ncbi:MAG TPA: alpha-2-macroglobulin family protein [Pyrinomonadaceae bacterium]|jgi:hypothetical protein
MKITSASLLLIFYALLVVQAQQQTDYKQLKAEAERHYGEASYARSYELYEKAAALKPPAEEARWVQFRLADTLWRAQNATETADSTKFDRAREQLEDLVRDRADSSGEHDLVWAEAQQSLGDFWWARRESHNWATAWPYYQRALDWWAGAREVEAARARYIKLVWSITSPAYAETNYYYSYYGNVLPTEILENVLKIATSADDKAHAHYLLAMTLRMHGEYQMRQRVPEEFEAALASGKGSDWYDDALFFYADWMASRGPIRQLENGEWAQEADFVRGLELYRRLLKEFRKGETRYYDQAEYQVDSITRPNVSINTTNIFLPDSEVQTYLSWRNVRRIDFALYRVELPRDVSFPNKDTSGGMWIQQIGTAGREKVRAWSKETGDKGDHKPGGEMMRLDGKLPVGAYLLEATSDNGTRARDLLLVTDATLVLKTAGRRALIYFCHAMTGAPLPGASVKLWQKVYEKQDWVWHEQSATTDADGLARFDLAANSQPYSEIFVSAASDGRQAFSTGNSNHSRPDELTWRIYAFTDRPAYRPHETAQWKFIARKYGAGVYSTPAHQVIEFQITDPRGTKVTEGKATLNAFGSAWGSLEVTETMPLGEYQVTFWDEGRRHGIGSATLFRLEEYKLPEFKVTISTPEENGKKRAFRLGDKVEIKVRAAYYFGGPVSKGTVEVLVYQNPFYHYWTPPRDYPWYYDAPSQAQSNYGGGGQIVKRERLKLGPDGTATLVLDTPRYAQQDFEYRIVARVSDASRREVVASEDVRVTRQRYYVYPRAAHNIYRPQDRVQIETKALDANNQPVVAEGLIKVTRDYWYEVWIDPKGKEVKGDELRRLRERYGEWPNTQPPLQGWRLKFRGYEHEDITSETVRTNAEGTAEFSFTPAREGYYHITWSSRDGASQINAETYVWVATNATNDVGYRYGGLQLILDSDTFVAGQTSPVMIVAPSAGAYVLFSVEGENLDSYRLIHMTGTARLVELPIEEKHVPNIFLSVSMVRDSQLFVDTRQVIVPPTRQFLNVSVKADREQYQPREEGMLTITTRDQMGQPVPAEVALGLVDESVFYIQQDLAADPRQFYYGTKRAQYVQTISTFQQKTYIKLVAGPGQQLVNARDQERAAFQKLSVDGMNSPVTEISAINGSVGAVAETVTITAAADEMTAARAEFGAASGRRPQNFALLAPGASATPAPTAQEPAVQVRSDFRSTVFWQPDVVTDQQGVATVKVKYPDSLTGWQATARVASAGNQFGIGSANTRTKQPLIVRLQAPRFFLVGDQVTVSAVINNNTDQPLKATPELSAEGLTISGRLVDGKLTTSAPPAVDVKANGEARVDWLVNVTRSGAAKIRVTARGDQYSDAMENNFAVYEHGIEKFLYKSGKLRANEAIVRLDVPAARKPESTQLTVQVAPSMAVTMLDALPYLIDYPYGCTEQTISRFLPAVITAKTLKDLGLSPEVAMSRVFGGIEPASAAATHPDGKRSLKQLDAITRQSLERLYGMQHEDGGWGWWKDDESDHFMTAYVVWGLVLARGANIEVDSEALDNAVEYLDQELVEEEASLDRQAWLLHALAAHHAAEEKDQDDMSESQTKAFENLWANRDKLNAYTRALLALSAHYFGYQDKAMTLVRNLENGVKIDRTPDTSVIQRGAQSSDPTEMATAHWGEDGIYYRWSDGGVEATSFALRALLTVDPQNRLVEPVTNWLIKNRRGAQWSNTRDTAITVLALNDYLRRSGEGKPDLEYEVLVNGRSVVSKRLAAADALSAPSQFHIPRELIRDGANEIRILRKGGTSPLYFAAQASFFSLEEPIKAAGNEIFVRREYFKLVGRPTLLKGYVYDRVPLRNGEDVASGDRIEVVVTIEAKNNYEYLLFEDLKPAGFEAVEVRSGESASARELRSGAVERKFPADSSHARPEAMRAAGADENEEVRNANYTGRSSYVYQELRDRKVALFVDSLAQGVWEIRYDLRAEAPGSFHALPMLGHAMYVPEIRCNDEELKVRVTDQR